VTFGQPPWLGLNFFSYLAPRKHFLFSFLFFPTYITFINMPAAASSGIARGIYNTLFKKNSIFITSVFVSAIAFEVVYDSASTAIWDKVNKGVSQLSTSRS
jgi:ubiquinol-cytochrome c reductase subunit 9